MSAWHLVTRSGQHVACAMPPLMRDGCVCGHETRASARREAKRFGLRVVKGECPTFTTRRAEPIT